ncbi:hypothetical protein GCM10009119_16810 [Algoriphagus jejuensis]|uniref:Nucleoside 2-deoxyribosyltransferase-like protein n=1 Tax=Algoriphagus jejuensis TaxID=419934 RepID=A0ABN1MYZ0_9BACT
MDQPMPLESLLEQTRQVDFSLPEHEPLLVQTINYLGKYGVLCRQDRLQLQLAFLELTGIYLKNYLNFPNEAEVMALRKDIQQGYQNLYAPNSMGLRCHQFLEDVSQRIHQQEYLAALKTITDSFQDLAKWEYTSNPVNDALFETLILQLQSLQMLVQFTETYPEDHVGKNAAEQLLANRFIQFQENGFVHADWLKTAEELSKLKPSFSEPEYAYYFNVLVALVLYFDPDYTPALEQMSEEHATSIQVYLASIQPEELSPVQLDGNLDIPEIIGRYKDRLVKDGFSEHAIYESISLIKKKLEDESLDFDGYLQFVQDLVESSRSYATPEINESLDEMVKGLFDMKDYFENLPESVTAEDVKKEMETGISEMNLQLEAGHSINVVLTRFFNKFNLVALRIAGLSEMEMPVIADLFKLFLPAVLRLVEKNIPEEMRPFYPQLQQFYAQITVVMEQLAGPEWQQEIAMQSLDESNQRFIGSVNLLPIAPEFENNRMIKQFVALFPQLATRMMALDENLKGEDKKEFERIQAAREDTMNLLRSAYTLKQLIQHQQFGLRQIAYDIGQFEQRKLLYFSPSSFPTYDVILHVNQVFFSGTHGAKNVLERSCSECGLQLATQKSNTTSLDDRWIQLRESGLAIFDFSDYDPQKSDPKGWAKGNIEVENNVLEAASQTAVAAFECGWALALGKPIVILLKAGQIAPFDIDIHPCYLYGNEDDVPRLIEAIQIATYGKPRLSKENILHQSSAYLKRISSVQPTEKTKALLQAIDANEDDATLLELVGKSLFNLNPGEKHMIFSPPFAGSYPTQTGKKQLFHVTAFRTWSKATEAVIKAVCGGLNIEYRVGYDNLDPEIMGAIWKDLTASHFIIADITLLNPNACLELAIAMALGKPTLIIHQHDFIQNFFLPLLKIRTHTYDAVNSSADFQMLLKSFLNDR